MGYSYTRRKPTNTTESRLHRLLSGLPPTKFSIHQRHLHAKYSLRPKIHLGSGPATTKSWLPPPPRCCGGPPRLPQLRLFTARPPENPTPGRPHGHYLADPSSILETALERGEVSYWSLLECSDAKKAAAPSQPSDPLRRELRLSWVSLAAPDAAGSGIEVSYSVVMDPEALRGLSWRRMSMYRQAVTVRYECAVSDPFDARRKPVEFAAMTRFGFGGKLYGVSLQGAVAEMEVVGMRLRITGVGGTTRAAPTSRSRFFKEYLVEMEGEILLVFLIHHESVEVVDDVEILRLDSTRLDWIKVEGLRGKAMFLKESGCEWVESAEFGCRDNCVFFTEGKENNEWRVYDFKKCCISSVL